MFNNCRKSNKLAEKISQLEGQISQLKEKIPKEYEIRNIAIGVIDDEKKELKRLYEERERVREEVWDTMKVHIDDYAATYMEQLIGKKVKDIEDKLIVELARKAMNMEEKRLEGEE